MVEKIEWSQKAQGTFGEILNYLAKEWSEKEVAAFVERVEKKLALIRQFPRLGVPGKIKRNTFRTVVHKRVTLVYFFKPVKKEIVLVTFWNNWQNPEKLRI